MSEDVAGKLELPPRTSIDDPGAHDLESSDSDDHFSDAQSAYQHSPNSPVPITRVEKVDNEPSYGEVPGTEAYDLRAEDARPDQVAVIQDDEQNYLEGISPDRPLTPGGHPIPKTVLEKIDRTALSSGELPSTRANEARNTDALPDLVLEAGKGLDNDSRPKVDSIPGDLHMPTTRVKKEDLGLDSAREETCVQGSPTSSVTRSSTIIHTMPHLSSLSKGLGDFSSSRADVGIGDGGDGENSEVFGEDFDDFEQGGGHTEFGDFDDGFQEAEVAQPLSAQSLSAITPSFPILNFDNLEITEEILTAIEPYIEAIFPATSIDTSFHPKPILDNPTFLTQRSASLWSQLVAPPPLQPPNWVRSRIRRLFLVSLGVPIDLDEILPASTQKKLILPSVSLQITSPRTSIDSRNAGFVSRVERGDANASNTSIDSQDRRSNSKRRKGLLPAPDLDLVAARQLCTITNEALNGMTVEELREHVSQLESMQQAANEVLEYWTKRTDEKIGDREAFEGVIENLVKHARKVRK